MKTSYDYYLLACREADLQPISFWRFSISYGKYQRGFREALGWRMDDLPAKKRNRLVDRWVRLVRLADLVERGQELAELARRENNDDEPGATGAGDREPRVPLVPVLVGAAARPVPSNDPLKETYAWRV